MQPTGPGHHDLASFQELEYQLSLSSAGHRCMAAVLGNYEVFFFFLCFLAGRLAASRVPSKVNVNKLHWRVFSTEK